jgi:hypothetical protein
VSPEAGFQQLRHQARVSSRRLADLAQEVVQEARGGRVAALAVDDARVRAAEQALVAGQTGLARRTAALDRAQDDLDERERAADQRHHLADERDRAADQRNHLADQRDRDADQRDRDAEVRDRTARDTA